MMVGVGPRFRGFTLDRVGEEAVLCMPYLVVALENEPFKYPLHWVEMF